MADITVKPNLNGPTSQEARDRLAKTGSNTMPDASVHPLRMAMEKFWGPVPWMLEAAVVLQIVMGAYVEAGIIAALLVFNAGLGLFQEGRAQATLAALKSRLALTATVRRDGNGLRCPPRNWCAATSSNCLSAGWSRRT